MSVSERVYFTKKQQNHVMKCGLVITHFWNGMMIGKGSCLEGDCSWNRNITVFESNVGMAIPYSENLGQKKMIQTGTLPKLPRETGKNIFQPTNFLNFKTSWWFQHVSTPLKNISQIETFPQIGMKIKNIPNHPENVCFFPRGSNFPYANWKEADSGNGNIVNPPRWGRFFGGFHGTMVAKGVGGLQRFLPNKTSNVGIIPKRQLPLKTDPTTVTNPKAHTKTTNKK